MVRCVSPIAGSSSCDSVSGSEFIWGLIASDKGVLSLLINVTELVADLSNLAPSVVHDHNTVDQCQERVEVRV